MEKIKIKGNIFEEIEILDYEQQLKIAYEILNNISCNLFTEGFIDQSNELDNINELIHKFYNENKNK